MLSFITSNWWQILSSMLIAYLLGSINFAVIITRFVEKGKDIRDMGSGNAGFTNVLRSVGKGPAVFTILFDFIKGILAVFIAGLIFTTVTHSNEVELSEYIAYGKYLAGLCCIIGHMYPVFFGFKGGKGVVTAAALMLVEDWRVFLLIITTFLIVFLITKIISISSIICGILYGIYTFAVTYYFDFLPSQSQAVSHSFTYVIAASLFAFGIGMFVIVKHKENIKRILKGEEKKITAKKS